MTLRRHPSDGARWLKNTPTFTVYLPFFFAVGAGLLFSSFPWASLSDAHGPFRSFPIGALVLIVLIIIMFLAAFAALEDLKRPLVEPFMFKDYLEPLRIERNLRRRLKSEDFDLLERNELVQAYAAAAPPLMTLRGLRDRGGACAFVSFLLNLIAAETIAVLFWYLGISQLFDISSEKAIVATHLGLLCLWFPLRLYTEWYLNFYSLEHLKRYWAFWFVLVAAILAYGFYCFGVGGIAEIFSLSVAGTLALVGILGKVKPEWLGFLADVGGC